MSSNAKLLLTEEEFDQQMKGRRFKRPMTEALRLVLVEGLSYAEAAERAGLGSFQLVGRRARQIREDYVQSTCPEGWLRRVLLYPPELKAAVDELGAEIEKFRIKALAKGNKKGNI